MGYAPPSNAITALVLAGGQASRMGGCDKGLQDFHGTPLALHAARRIAQGGEVATVLISANRHRPTYASWGWPVVGDELAGFQGPLAGFLAGWSACQTEYLLTLPCDTPFFPHDLARHMHATLVSQGARIALACAPESAADPSLRRQPAFCLMHRSVAADLAQFVAEGGRKIGAWAQRHPLALVAFNRANDSPEAFANANTLEELQRLHTLNTTAP